MAGLSIEMLAGHHAQGAVDLEHHHACVVGALEAVLADRLVEFGDGHPLAAHSIPEHPSVVDQEHGGAEHPTLEPWAPGEQSDESPRGDDHRG